MTNELDFFRAPPSMVIQMVLKADDRVGFDRCFAAAVDAAAGAATTGVVGAWRIVVGTLQNQVDEKDLEHFKEWARSNGGQFSHKVFALPLDRHVAHLCLARSGDETLVLVLEPSTVILTSTIIRLVEAHDILRTPVVARGIPIGPDSVAGSVLNDEHLCVLTTRLHIEENVASGIFSELCPNAMAFPLTQLGGLVETPERDHRSLLEELFVEEALMPLGVGLSAVLTGGIQKLLSVVVRTQVARPEALRESLLSLAGQVDGRFELLLVVHDADRKAAELILDDQPVWLRSRARILIATGGTRSHPINVGVAGSRGSHVAFLDDDDVVFCNWVGSFLDGASQYPRRLLRTAAGVQVVTSAEWPAGVQGHAVDRKITTPYPVVFNLPDNLKVNMTPFMAFAFPRAFFEVFGGADESLEVCEDWDLVLRAACVLGVVDLGSLTAVYRRWSSGGDSYSAHPSAVWTRDMTKVRRKIDSRPVLLPAGSASELSALAVLRSEPAELAAVYASTSWRITRPLRDLMAGLLVLGARMRSIARRRR